jgi:hypothetical protein
MALRKTRPLRFAPAGLSDSLDTTDEFPGACAILQNLIPDPTTKDIWTCRPASLELTGFPGFTTPGVVSVFKVIGSLVYGLISSGLTAGYDQPFCYNILTNAFVTVSGITSANVPLTPAATGDWTPPTMDLCGINLVVTHPGFDGITNFFGWFDTTNPAAPVWHAGNTAAGSTITFMTIPAWVRQFNGRAWFGINPAAAQPSVVFTDSLTLKVTNASQALTFGDNLPLTCAIGLPLSNQLGGVIQALLVFKGVSNIVQITGDAATTNLALNTLNAATGTLSPRSLCVTPQGISFLAPDGIRLIDFDARVSDPIGAEGTGVVVPFLSPPYPSRVACGANAAVLRVNVQNSRVNNTPWQEYWYDLIREVWSGPHTFPASMLDTYNAVFIIAPQSVPAALFSSKTVPDSTTSSTENGVALTWHFKTSMLPDNEAMQESELLELQIKTTVIAALAQMVVSALDQNGSVYGSAVFPFAGGGATLWGSFVWGGAAWGGNQAGLYPRYVTFSAPVVFNRLAIDIQGGSAQGFSIGDLFMRVRTLGYTQLEAV